MAESEETTTETTEEVTSTEATAEAPASEEKPAGPTATRKERNAAARAAKAKSPSGPRTLEERLAGHKLPVKTKFVLREDGQ